MNTPPENTHYAWGASAAKQWRGCAGSVAYIAQCKAAGMIPAKVDTAYSLEGTEAHDWADRCTRHYNLGTITVNELSRLDNLITDKYTNFLDKLQTNTTITSP